jgi:16S rRNA G966 N2-methylase RsmD
MDQTTIETRLEIAKTAAQIAEKETISDTTKFALKNSSKYTPELLKAILNHQKFKEMIAIKTPEWTSIEGLISPEKVSLEQASSKTTADLKLEFISGKSILDLTGGLGVDSFYFSKKFGLVTHNEPSLFLSALVEHNFNKLQVKNVAFTQFLAEEFNSNSTYDVVFIDPDRRNTENKKLVLLSDCKPDIAHNQKHWFLLAPVVMIKLSPMLDIKACINQLKNIQKVIIISDKNEVKELVLLLKKDFEEEPGIICLNKTEKITQRFEFTYSEENQINLSCADPVGYLYEPNASVLKAGAFKAIALKFNIKKIAVNSHLYSSEFLFEDFPGRVFEIIAIEKPNKKELEKYIINKQANISCRNYPLKPEQIKKELGWKDGGDFYVFFTENQKKKKIVLICRKIQLPI